MNWVPSQAVFYVPPPPQHPPPGDFPAQSDSHADQRGGGPSYIASCYRSADDDKDYSGGEGPRRKDPDSYGSFNPRMHGGSGRPALQSHRSQRSRMPPLRSGSSTAYDSMVGDNVMINDRGQRRDPAVPPCPPARRTVSNASSYHNPSAEQQAQAEYLCGINAE